MADKVRISVSAVPQELLTTENSTTKWVLASEVNTTLGGACDSSVVNFSQTATNQGYKDAAVHYVEAPVTVGGTPLSGITGASSVVIVNTGYDYSSATALGDANTNYIKVMVGATNKYPIAYLAPGGAVAFPGGPTTDIQADNIYIQTVDTTGAATAAGTTAAVRFIATV